LLATVGNHSWKASYFIPQKKAKRNHGCDRLVKGILKKPFGKLTWPLKTAISRRFTFEKMVIFAICLFPRMLIPGFVQKNPGRPG
jgi:hypothetical protein